MATYEDGRVRRLDESLRAHGIDTEAAAQIMEGGDAITRTSSPQQKADWMRGAMDRMDHLLDPEPRHAVRESCACCLGGKRLAINRSIVRDHATLEERVAAANAATFVFGHSVTMDDGERLTVRFSPDGHEPYWCPCLPVSPEPLSITYCYCCGGHVKHHLQIALGRKLDVTVVETALSTAGKRPCMFSFEFAD